jgi:hypothetical protein
VLLPALKNNNELSVEAQMDEDYLVESINYVAVYEARFSGIH